MGCPEEYFPSCHDAFTVTVDGTVMLERLGFIGVPISSLLVVCEVYF
jgi:hypothetical protein